MNINQSRGIHAAHPISVRVVAKGFDLSIAVRCIADLSQLIMEAAKSSAWKGFYVVLKTNGWI